MFAFVRAGVERIIDFTNLWLAESRHLAAVEIVRYEDLRADPLAGLARVTAFLGTPGSRDELEPAVAYGAFDNMKKLESAQAFGAGDRKMAPSDPRDPRSYKVRRAKIGGYRDYFSDEQVRALDELVRTRLAPELGYAEAPKEGGAPAVWGGGPVPINLKTR